MGNLIKTRNLIELTIGFISILLGLILTFEYLSLLYKYNFTNALFFYMEPMTTLISELIIGLMLIFSGYFLLTCNNKLTLFYKLTGILIFFNFFNQILLDKIKFDGIPISFINSLVVSIIGLFLFLFFNRKKYKIFEEKYTYLKSDGMKIP